MKVAIIGGGAAGFFAAINAKYNFPNAEVSIFEKTTKTLSKVKVSGGGRCNVTNGANTISELTKGYPRGGKNLKKLFPFFDNKSIVQWFESNNVPLYIQDDGRVFPKSNNSESIINCFENECGKLNIDIKLQQGIREIASVNNQLCLKFLDEKTPRTIFDRVIVTTGGFSKMEKYNWLKELGHAIENPVPSLFTFNMPKDKITHLMGVVANNVLVKIQGTKLKSEGPLLITHWGMSGPAILKLSAFGAKELAAKKYDFSVQVNWANENNNELIYKELNIISAENPHKILSNIKPFGLPVRLWLFLLDKSGIAETKKWGELGKKGIHKLVNILSNDVYAIKGKTTFKEEFVTCGGVSLDSINMKTMESKVIKNLYFAGEVLDIDGVTGGYNFQAAWTTAFVAAMLKGASKN